MIHFDNHLLETVFWWSIISAWPALDEVTKSSLSFECGQFINIGLHLPFQVFTSTFIDDMFQESIVQKVPIEVQNGPDFIHGYWFSNVDQLVFDEASMQGTV